MRRHEVVLYNPRAVFFTLPLALVALGSRLDPRRYTVRVVDGRLESDPVATLQREAENALCVGMTVLTGAPIRDALHATRAIRQRRPDLPIIWGGWHPSLFPAATVEEAGLDACVMGQGEETFAEIVDRLAEGDRALKGVEGAAVRQPGGGDALVNSSRAFQDINEFPEHDFGLIPLERYFALKGQRQLDYVSSQGCRFRCSFCADPYVYRRSWSGYRPERVGDELERLWHRYRFEDVAFQDETFFTSAKRVAAIADEILKRGLRFTWTATMRADQGARLDDTVMAACVRSGLRRVMVGVEAGSQPLMDAIHKDVRIDQVWTTAATFQRHGLKGLFNFIVGFPGETKESIDETLRMARRIRTMSSAFEVALFYYKPYPGNPLADALAEQNFEWPGDLEAWSDFDYVGTPSSWLDQRIKRRIERFKFYQRIGWSRSSWTRAPVQALARWRCMNEMYGVPVEKLLIERWRRPAELS